MRSKELIEKYQLQAHPEGGYFSEVYTAPYMYSDTRETGGSIYFLLDQKDISHFHVIDCDEIWYYHEGCGMRITMIDPDGTISYADLGMNLEKKESAMVVIPKGVIFAAENLDKEGYTFVSCATTPQFQYQGFKLVKESEVTCDTKDISYLFMSDEEIDHTVI